MRAPIRTFLADRRANAATEFAFILPVMLLLIAGIVEFGRMFQVYDSVNRLATRYASVYADCNDSPSGTCNTELGLYWPTAALKNIAPQLTNTGTIVIRMFQVKISAAGATTIVYSQPSGQTLSTIEQQRATSAIFNGLKQQTGVVVTIGYTHQLLFFPSIIQQFIPNNMLNVTYTVAQRAT